MSSALALRPSSAEYAPYYVRYISLVPEGDIIQTLSQQLEDTLSLLSSIPESKAGYRYAPDKWSIKEVIGHIIDAERVFAYRALRFARNDKTPLASFEQDDYVRTGGFDERKLADLAEEFEHVRRGNIRLFSSFSNEALSRTGIASEKEVSVRALLYIIAGHERHHIEILKSRYL
ncbi:MAG TPA: DinB family protein [Blastocatellia bacterium]|nr:DinB family protein [Blastocatellia bacterium]